MGHPLARDHLMTKGPMLAKYITEEGKPLAGIRIDIPDFLSSDFKTLEGYGARMRRINGKMTKKYVKLDDNYGLYLHLRLPGEDTWLRITPSLARDLTTPQIERKLIATGGNSRQEGHSKPVNNLPIIPHSACPH